MVGVSQRAPVSAASAKDGSVQNGRRKPVCSPARHGTATLDMVCACGFFNRAQIELGERGERGLALFPFSFKAW